MPKKNNSDFYEVSVAGDAILEVSTSTGWAPVLYEGNEELYTAAENAIINSINRIPEGETQYTGEHSGMGKQQEKEVKIVYTV